MNRRPLPVLALSLVLLSTIARAQTLSQTTDSTTIGTGYTCGVVPVTEHGSFSYLRSYDLAAEGITAPIAIQSITFGVSSATSAAGSQPVEIAIWRDLDGGAPDDYATFQLLDHECFQLPDSAATVHTQPLTDPVVVGCNDVIVVEVYFPSGVGLGNLAYIGGNALGETADGYSTCGSPNPVDLTTSGLPNFHVIIDVNYAPAAPLVRDVTRVHDDPPTTSAVDFAVTFDREVTGVDATDFESTLPGNAVTAVSTAAFGDRAQFLSPSDRIIASGVTGLSASAFTVEFWARVDCGVDQQPLFSYAQGSISNAILLWGPEDLSVYLQNGGASPGTVVSGTGVSIADNRWHHLAVTWESGSGTLRIYKDRVLAFETTALPGTSIPVGGTVVLGEDQDAVGGGFDPNQVFTGELDEVRVWDHARSAPEIRRYAGIPVTGSEPGLALAWSFDGATPTLVTDVSPNGNDATNGGAGGTPATIATSTVPVAHVTTTANGFGALGLRVLADGTIVDVAGGLPLAGLFDASQTYSLAGPASVLAVTRASASPSNGTSHAFDVSFNQPVSGVDASDFVPSGSAAGAAVASIASNFGDALDLDALSDRVVLAGYAIPPNAITVEMWVKSTQTMGPALFSYAVPGGGAEANHLLLQSPADLRLWLDGVLVVPTTGIDVSDGNWHHVAVTWRSETQTISFYKDGNLEATAALTYWPCLVPGGTLVVGDEQDVVGGGFDPTEALLGQVDEFRIWDHARSAAQIATDRGSPLTGTEPGLSLYWSFDGVTGSTVPDLSGQGNAGVTSAGTATLVSDVPSPSYRVTVALAAAPTAPVTLGLDVLDDGTISGVGGPLAGPYTGGEVFDLRGTFLVPGDFASIGGALASAAVHDGALISVAAGTYNESLDFGGKNVTVSGAGAALTIIDPQQSGRAVVFQSGEGPGAVLQDVGIQGGRAPDGVDGVANPFPGLPPQVGRDGGGLLITNGASPAIRRCAIRACRAGGGGNADFGSTWSGARGGRGGGAAVLAGSPRFEACIFEQNLAGNGGSGAWLTSSSNVQGGAGGNGGAVFVAAGASPEFVNCSLFGNRAGNGADGAYTTNPLFGDHGIDGGPGGHGGGLASSGAVTLENCVFRDNHAGDGGDAPVSTPASFPIYGGSGGSGGALLLGAADAVRNTIVWGNAPGLGGGHYPGGSTAASGTEPSILGTATVDWSDVAGGYPGAGNIDADPLFVDAAGGNLRLNPGSPCVDAGDPAGVLAATDLDGNPRIAGGRIDMGPYELVPAFPGTGEDFTMTVEVNGSFRATTNPIAVAPGDLVTLRFDSPGNTFVGLPLLLLGHPFPTGSPPVGPFPFNQVLHIDVAQMVILIGEGSFLGAPVVAPGGSAIGFVAPPFPPGTSVMLQSVAVHFQPVGFQNPLFASSDGVALSF